MRIHILGKFKSLKHSLVSFDLSIGFKVFQRKCISGVGRLLRLYDLGRKKLLRKCENKHIPHLVVDIKTVGERIICSDVQVNINSHKYEDTMLVCQAGVY